MKDRINLANKEKLATPLKEATLCFLLKDNKILLAMKKRGFGKGKWNGIGGKMDSEKDKDIKEAAIRETKEEIGVTLASLKHVATLNFYQIGKQEGNQKVTVYISKKWQGEPTESEEMAPKWFEFGEIPYNDMWVDDKFWLPKVLENKKIEGDFLFDENQILIEHDIKPLR
jgi:8-oxo-dGTP pyrophosphatase MutT (NUDIX family)